MDGVLFCYSITHCAAGLFVSPRSHTNILNYLETTNINQETKSHEAWYDKGLGDFLGLLKIIQNTCLVLDRVEVAGSSPVGIIAETLAQQGFFIFYWNSSRGLHYSSKKGKEMALIAIMHWKPKIRQTVPNEFSR